MSFIYNFRIDVYERMTTIRLDEAQKKKLAKAARLLEASTGRKLSQGDAVEALSEFALRNRELLSESSEIWGRIGEDDPFFDPALIFDLGRTDERTHDRVLYRKR